MTNGSFVVSRWKLKMNSFCGNRIRNICTYPHSHHKMHCALADLVCGSVAIQRGSRLHHLSESYSIFVNFLHAKCILSTFRSARRMCHFHICETQQTAQRTMFSFSSFLIFYFYYGIAMLSYGHLFTIFTYSFSCALILGKIHPASCSSLARATS